MSLYIEYSILANMGGIFDDFDDVKTEEEAESRAYERLQNELADLVLKRPAEELKEFFKIKIEKVQAYSVEEGEA